MKQPANTKKFDKRTKEPRSRIRKISPKKIVSKAQRVVKLAADILEEEIAAGIIAAKEIEKKVINVDDIRSEDSDHIMSRFRSDAHEVIDMLMDVVSVASTQLDNISKRVVSIAGIEKENTKRQMAQVPIIRNENTNNPGSEAVISMQLKNESKENVMNVELRETDLVAPSGHRILARNMTMRPKVLNLKPGDKKEAKILVKIPRSTKSGIYSGLIQDKKINSLQAMLTLEIIK